MGDDKRASTSVFGWVFWAFIWGAVGYFIYGEPQGIIALAFFSAITSLTAFLGLIPIVGVWLTFVTTNCIKNWLLQYITMSWAISWIFGLTLLGSTLFTLFVLITISVVVSNR
ncbi:hypothetical protein ES705_36410 [subsurface metagenome]